MILLTATTHPEISDHLLNAGVVAEVPVDFYHNKPNIGVVPAYQKLWEQHKDLDFLMYAHDDIAIHDHNWFERVAMEFMDPDVAVVGFGGATGIGTPELYKTPYRIQQLIRHDYRSNQTGWNVHGLQEIGERDVAVVDGFFMAVRGTFLKQIGGWAWMQCEFHCYDLAMCLEAIRRGKKVRTVGVNCTHFGGGTSTKAEYVDWLKERGRTPEQDHLEPHIWLADRYRDLLPYHVK